MMSSLYNRCRRDRHLVPVVTEMRLMMVMAMMMIFLTLTTVENFSSYNMVVDGFKVGHSISIDTGGCRQQQQKRCLCRSPMPHTSSTSTRTTSLSMGIGSGLGRIRDSILSKPRTDKDLKIGIAGFYDRSSKLWEDVWGEHMHHGYYVPPDRSDHVQAQIDLIDEVLKWSNVSADNAPKKVVDVGCGIGGSSRHIARLYGCTTEGVTLSPYQANRGNELATEQGLASQCHFQVADALSMPFPDREFDLVWSLESGEHMPDKTKFVDELFRVCTPGGRIIIVTWCHRDLEDGETSLTKKEEKLLAKINRAYYLPKWCSVQDYVDLLEAKGAVDVKRDDWSYIIAPFWKAVIKSSLSLRSVWGLLKSGPTTIRGAYAMLLMLRGFNTGLIKFGLITCAKAQS